MKDVTRKIGPRPVAAKPRLLMLSHCVPAERQQDSARSRAWQLLEVFGRSHEIHLACLADGPVSLMQWRSLHARTKQIVIEPVSRLRRMMAAMMHMISPVRSQLLLTSRMLRQPVSQWSARLPIETVLCTTPMLLEAAGQLQCTRITDLLADTTANAAYLSLCDAVIVSDALAAAQLPLQDHRMIVLPGGEAASTLPAMRLTPQEDLEPIALPMPMHKAA